MLLVGAGLHRLTAQQGCGLGLEHSRQSAVRLKQAAEHPAHRGQRQDIFGGQSDHDPLHGQAVALLGAPGSSNMGAESIGENC